MKIISLTELRNMELYVHNVVGIKQVWCADPYGQSYDYMECPRKSSGLVLFLSPGVTYHFPDGTEYAPEAGDLMSIPAGSRYRVTGGMSTRSYLVVFNLSADDIIQKY